MTKRDLKFIAVLSIIAMILSGGYFFYTKTRADKISQVSVYYHNEQIMTFDLDQDATYDLKGDYGMMHIEVKNQAYRVYDVECPNHDCEQVGWVEKGSPKTILCVPNDVFIKQNVEE